MFDRLSLENFTVFAKADFEFTNGVNVYVGENGTGKTHVLKLLYAVQKNQYLRRSESPEEFGTTLREVFRGDSVGRLVTRSRGEKACDVELTWGDRDLRFHFKRSTKTVEMEGKLNLIFHPIFVPPKDILAHTINFADAYDTILPNGQRWLDFDVTYRDLVRAANPDVPQKLPTRTLEKLSDLLGESMTGKVIRKPTGRLYLKDEVGEIEFPLVAEGWRKLGLLWILIRNGSLGKGSVLYWDEPEANLNPKLFQVLAKVLVELAASGRQIHIASHSYAFIRELEIARANLGKKQPAYQLFALEKTASGVAVNPASSFAELDPNPILEEYLRLFSYDAREALTSE